jgi:hypothetical protein
MKLNIKQTDERSINLALKFRVNEIVLINADQDQDWDILTLNEYRLASIPSLRKKNIRETN